MLGTDICAAAENAGHEVFACGHAELDVTDGTAVEAKFKHVKPDVVINCAAWTDVDRAEAAEQAALAVNGSGAGNVAAAGASIGAWTIHISTDYVFDGKKRQPYLESDRPAPLSAYGRSKLAGEQAVADAAPDAHTTVRTSWLFGKAGPCFPQTILRLASERGQLTVVDDQVGAPTFTGHLARALLELADSSLSGVVHLAGAGECSWFEFAREIVARAGLTAEIRPGSTQETARPAPRPAYSVLRTERPGVPTLQHWQEGLAEFLATGVTTA
jgi:dTDP-4-dehydrorhamnose reductase